MLNKHTAMLNCYVICLESVNINSFMPFKCSTCKKEKNMKSYEKYPLFLVARTYL